MYFEVSLRHFTGEGTCNKTPVPPHTSSFGDLFFVCFQTSPDHPSPGIRCIAGRIIGAPRSGGRGAAPQHAVDEVRPPAGVPSGVPAPEAGCFYHTPAGVSSGFPPRRPVVPTINASIYSNVRLKTKSTQTMLQHIFRLRRNGPKNVFRLRRERTRTFFFAGSLERCGTEKARSRHGTG